MCLPLILLVFIGFVVYHCPEMSRPIIPAFLIIMAFFLPSILGAENPPASKTLTGWEYAWSDSSQREIKKDLKWNSYDFPGIPPGRNGRNIIWLKVRLPDTRIKNTVLYLPKVYLLFNCYLENTLLYRFGNVYADEKDIFKGLPWHIIPLESGDKQAWQGKTLYFQIRSEYRLIGILHDVTLEEESACIRKIITGDLSRIVLSILFMAAGVFAFTGFFLKRTLKLLLPFGFITFFGGVHTIYYSYVKQLFIDKPEMWNYLWLISVSLMIIGGLQFIEQLFGAGYKSLIRRAWQLHGFYLLAALLLFLLHFFSAASYLATFRLVLYTIEVIVVTPVLVRAFMEGNREAKILLIGLSGFMLFGLLDILSAMRLLPYYKFSLQWGVLILTCSLSYIIVERILEAQRIALNYHTEVEKVRMKERQYIYADIHDHLGSKLNDLSILLKRIEGEEKTESPLFQSLKKILDESSKILRERIAAADDIEAMSEDFFYGLHLVLLRRYTNKGRKLLFQTENKIEEVLRRKDQLSTLSLLYTLAEEISTNDIKYGLGTASWSFSKTGEALLLVVKSETLYDPEKQARGNGGKNIKFRVSEEGGEVHQSISGGIFSVKITIPIRKKQSENWKIDLLAGRPPFYTDSRTK